MFAGVALVLKFIMFFDTVEMINKFPEDANFYCVSLHGDFVYIGSDNCILWNVITNAIVRLDAYPG